MRRGRRRRRRRRMRRGRRRRRRRRREKSCRKIKTHTLCSVTFSRKPCR